MLGLSDGDRVRHLRVLLVLEGMLTEVGRLSLGLLDHESDLVLLIWIVGGKLVMTLLSELAVLGSRFRGTCPLGAADADVDVLFLHINFALLFFLSNSFIQVLKSLLFYSLFLLLLF